MRVVKIKQVKWFNHLGSDVRTIKRCQVAFNSNTLDHYNLDDWETTYRYSTQYYKLSFTLSSPTISRSIGVSMEQET